MTGVAPRNGQTRVNVTGNFGARLCHRLGLNPNDVLVRGFRVEFLGQSARITYRTKNSDVESQRVIPADSVVALMEG